MAAYVIVMLLVLSLVLWGMFIPPSARYELWPRLRRLEKPSREDRDVACLVGSMISLGLSR